MDQGSLLGYRAPVAASPHPGPPRSRWARAAGPSGSACGDKVDDPDHGYKQSSGLCFSSVAQPELTLTCDQGKPSFTSPFDVSVFRTRFTGTTIRDRSYAFTPDPVDPTKFVPAGYTELKVTVTGKKATGSVRGVRLPAGFPAGGNTTCDSGEVAFTAKRK